MAVLKSRKQLKRKTSWAKIFKYKNKSFFFSNKIKINFVRTRNIKNVLNDFYMYS